MNIIKKQYGQYFTTTNPFTNQIFQKWFDSIPSNKKNLLIEPFAGSGNILKMLPNCKFLGAFDIDPKHPDVIALDTIESFPPGYSVAITNPPYLAKSAAIKNGLYFGNSKYDNLYKTCLEVMLSHLEYVAAIVPEGFVKEKLFQNRLYSIITLPYKMFEDTACPVCLALFVPESSDFTLYSGENFIGYYSELLKKIPTKKNQIKWKFNDPNGEIGIRCLDNNKTATIKFVEGLEIKKVKNTSRHLTRVSGLPPGIDTQKFINECNKALNKFRSDTGDIFLSPFKELRQDGLYRRRLDYHNAKIIMNSIKV